VTPAPTSVGYLGEMRTVLISGIPATGKTCFGNWLARNHGFLHVDLENSPQLPDPLRTQPLAFIDQARTGRSDMVVTWGFPPWPAHMAKVRELRAAGLVAWWFDGDRSAAFENFQLRADHPGTASDWARQLWLIEKVWSEIADFYGDRRIDVIGPGPSYLDPGKIFARMFG